MEIRVGVYVCHCGTNIAGVVDVEEVARYAATLPGVVVARNIMYTCSDQGQGVIREDIKKYNLNRVVIAACSPKMHESTFRKTL
ncbi:MAG: disulfide reductase, partial [Candidatus Jordarchaeales archaeon]